MTETVGMSVATRRISYVRASEERVFGSGRLSTRNPSQEETHMPKYLVKASYNAEGAKGLMKDGGTARRVAVQNLIKGLGGQARGVLLRLRP